MELVEVEWEPPEPVVDAGSLLVHENLGSNLVYDQTFAFGDVEGDSARADRVSIS